MENTVEILAVKKDKMQKLAIPLVEGYQFIDLNNILYFESNANYTYIYLVDNTKIISSKHLGYYEENLKWEAFLRVHNSFIINLTKVSKYIRGDEAYMMMFNKKIIPVSKSKKEDVLRLLRLD